MCTKFEKQVLTTHRLLSWIADYRDRCSGTHAGSFGLNCGQAAPVRPANSELPVFSNISWREYLQKHSRVTSTHNGTSYHSVLLFVGGCAMRGDRHLRWTCSPEDEVRAFPAKAHEHQPHPWSLPLPCTLPYLLEDPAWVSISCDIPTSTNHSTDAVATCVALSLTGRMHLCRGK